MTNSGLSLAIKDHVSGIASKLDAMELRHERKRNLISTSFFCLTRDREPEKDFGRR